MRIQSIAVVVLALLLSSCAPSVAGHGNYEIRGKLINAETGEEVSRQNIWVHVFNDSIKDLTSLDQADQPTFTVRMPLPEVRLRVVSRTNLYKAYETTVSVPQTGLDQIIPLVPTHFVLLKGRLRIRKGEAWIPLPPPEKPEEIGAWPMLSFDEIGKNADFWHADLGMDNSFELRLPRTRLHPTLLDTSLCSESDIDLTGETGDVVERDLHLVPWAQK